MKTWTAPATVDHEVDYDSVWSAAPPMHRRRRPFAVLLTAAGALVVAIPLTIWAVVGEPDRSPQTTPQATPAVVGPVVPAAQPTATVPSQVATTSAPTQSSSSSAGLPRHYTAVPLPGLSASAEYPPNPNALNERGQVVGAAIAANGHTHPVLWQNGKVIDLGVLNPGTEGEMGIAQDINNNGDIVGGCNSEPQQRAVLWRNGQIIDLGTLNGNPTFAYAINDKGQIIGISHTPTGEARGFIWENGQMRDLGIDGGVFPHDINNSGQVVGELDFDPGGAFKHAFLWENGVVTRLPAPGVSSSASAINDRGEIVGGYTLDFEVSSQAVRWYHGTMTELGRLGQGSDSSAGAINGKGLILGVSNVKPHSDEARPFLWWRGELHDLVPAGIPWESAYYLADLNNRGQILARTLYNPA